jgi:hypothetical protein
MAHYYAIAERGSGNTWWTSFPGRDGIISAADDAGQIVAQVQDALASAAMYGGRLPPAIEDGAKPPTDLSEFEAPAMVVVIPFARSRHAGRCLMRAPAEAENLRIAAPTAAISTSASAK